MGHVIILSGPVGAGKTAVSTELVKLLPEPLFYIEGDVFWRFAAKPGRLTRRDLMAPTMRAMTAAAAAIGRAGFTVLLDFSMPPAYLPTVEKIMRDVPFDYVLLCPPPDVCEARAATRSEGVIRDYGPYRGFYDLFEEGSHVRLTDASATEAETAREILAGLEAGAFRPTASIAASPRARRTPSRQKR